MGANQNRITVYTFIPFMSLFFMQPIGKGDYVTHQADVKELANMKADCLISDAVSSRGCIGCIRHQGCLT